VVHTGRTPEGECMVWTVRAPWGGLVDATGIGLELVE
jgi:hypothetical protein